MSSSPSALFSRPKFFGLVSLILLASPATLPAEEMPLPEEHFSVEEPANLSPAEAEAIYARIVEDMTAAYAMSQNSDAAGYRRWRRFNSAPYPAATHGNRYVSNYGNPAAEAYGRFEQAGRLPVGSILAKDSITVSEDGQAMPGALFLMEKMEAGFNYVSGDWRYTMIMPDGSLFGTTNGEGTERVRFCISCHLAVEKQDHLFFIPEEYRQN